MVPPPPSTPAPRRFLTKRPGASSSSQATPASAASRFQSTATPKLGTQRLEEVEDVESEDDLIAGSQDDQGPLHDSDGIPPSSWDEPQSEAAGNIAKRRKILDDSDYSTQEPLDGETAARQSPVVSEGSSQELVEDVKAVTSTTTNPVFRPAPRFKAPAEEDSVAETLLEQTSPRRKHASYVPGGLAEELQSWLSEVKGQTVPGVNSTDELRVPIAAARSGTRMCLVADIDGKNYILAGSAPSVAVDSVLLVRRPVWDIELLGETQTVVWNWAIEER
ncbi:hypothetical protein VHEMI09799 [[Torrubiella] hemipterigena]|uniref:Uncharacterized protein n=1 Tax=[Torrubiella] hemipterigena TaxID=1531966 RepID=A0A0A1TR11_9HYPO|nr:hypothetical protein VHEMI09799 [[Torrubiella] hemipterigena]